MVDSLDGGDLRLGLLVYAAHDHVGGAGLSDDEVALARLYHSRERHLEPVGHRAKGDDGGYADADADEREESAGLVAQEVLRDQFREGHGRCSLPVGLPPGDASLMTDNQSVTRL